MNPAYRLHGLTVRSDVPLDARTVPGETCDVEITRGENRQIGPDVPAERVIAQIAGPNGNFYSIFPSGPDTVIRYHGLCDFVIDQGAAQVTWHADPGGNEDLVPVMASGMLMATLLILRRSLVLHASAVEIDGAALAFVGRSGMGKSTLATLVALRGGALVSDDVLRVEPGEGAVCYAGATETRLREAATSLRDESAVARTTADDRTALKVPGTTADSMPLRAVIVPFVDKELRPILLERLGPMDGVLLLSRFPRVLGWEDAATTRAQFEGLNELVERVPVWRCRVPWGPPFDESLVDQLLTGIEWRG